MPNNDDIRLLVKTELEKIGDPSRRATLVALLVPPEALFLAWDYGKADEQFQCWLVGLSPDREYRLLYCEKGFGPSNPWGFVAGDDDGMGMDCQWYVSLEDVAINVGLLPAPPGYEVP
jgi:hypothetical protein